MFGPVVWLAIGLYLPVGGSPDGGPGRVETAGLVHNIATRDPNFEPLKDTICLLHHNVT